MIDKQAEILEKEKIVLVGLITRMQNESKVEEYLDELAFLVDTAGGNVVKRYTQKLDNPDSRYFIGSGKLKDICEYIKENEINAIVFDDELSPSQFRNIEKEVKCKVLDRSNLILDIFARRARTATAKLQVELAQSQYLLPRLTGLWTHLERQKGGIGLRGPGETEIETDRRVIRDRISLLKERLKEVDKQKQTQRKQRYNLVRVALVGYTNVGKSTIMNMLSKSDVFAENKLFATLDTTVRKVVVENLPFLLTDTVGFIRKLPHHLVESFKSTLDEVVESDILIHVVDISHPNFEEQIDVVNKTLQDLKSLDKPIYLVFNKIDAFRFTEKDPYDLMPEEKINFSLERWEETWMAKSNNKCIFISAKEKKNIDNFRKLLYNEVKEIHERKYPYNNFLW